MSSVNFVRDKKTLRFTGGLYFTPGGGVYFMCEQEER